MRVLTCTSRFLRVSAFVTAPTSSRKKRSAFMTRTSLLTCVIQQGSTYQRVPTVALTRHLQKHTDGGSGNCVALLQALGKHPADRHRCQLAENFLSCSFYIKKERCLSKSSNCIS